MAKLHISWTPLSVLPPRADSQKTPGTTGNPFRCLDEEIKDLYCGSLYKMHAFIISRCLSLSCVPATLPRSVTNGNICQRDYTFCCIDDWLLAFCSLINARHINEINGGKKPMGFWLSADFFSYTSCGYVARGRDMMYVHVHAPMAAWGLPSCESFCLTRAICERATKTLASLAATPLCHHFPYGKAMSTSQKYNHRLFSALSKRSKKCPNFTQWKQCFDQSVSCNSVLRDLSGPL